MGDLIDITPELRDARASIGEAIQGAEAVRDGRASEIPQAMADGVTAHVEVLLRLLEDPAERGYVRACLAELASMVTQQIRTFARGPALHEAWPSALDEGWDERLDAQDGDS